MTESSVITAARRDLSKLESAVALTGVSNTVLKVKEVRIAIWEIPASQAGFLPIILVHGASYSSQSVFNLPFKDNRGCSYSLMQGLQQLGVHCFAFDMSGYGGSSEPSVESDIESYVAELAVVVKHVTQKMRSKPIVVGWSWGGEVAGRYAQYYQDSIAGLVLWGTPWCGGDSDLHLKGPSVATFDAPRRVNTQTHSVADFRTSHFYDSEVARRFSEFALWVDSTAPNVCMRALRDSMPLFDPQRITLPVMLLYGAGDPVHHSSDPAFLLSTLGSEQKTIHLIKNSDHVSQFCRDRRKLWQILLEFSWSLSNKEIANGSLSSANS